MNLEMKVETVFNSLKQVTRDYQQPCFSCSFSNESLLLLDLIAKHFPEIEIFTIDTGRLHEETYNVMKLVQKRYQIIIKTFYPNSETLQKYVSQVGQNAFYDAIEHRSRCCQIRKVEPLTRALKGKDAWVTGLRWQHSVSRAGLLALEWDDTYQLTKINPILDWSDDELWAYIKQHNLPANTLYAKGYTSIGCAPCTRPITQGEEMRAGRWWWEQSDIKECGLHLKRKVN